MKCFQSYLVGSAVAIQSNAQLIVAKILASQGDTSTKRNLKIVKDILHQSCRDDMGFNFNNTK